MLWEKAVSANELAFILQVSSQPTLPPRLPLASLLASQELEENLRVDGRRPNDSRELEVEACATLRSCKR